MYKDLSAKKLKLGYISILGQVKTNKKYLLGMIWPNMDICPSSCLSAKRFFNRSAIGDLGCPEICDSGPILMHLQV